MDKYTFPTGTVGGRRAVGELRDKLVWMRRLRGPNVYPVVPLSDTFMKTRFGGRQRPHFKIVRWVRLGGEGGEVKALPPPPATQTLAQQTTAPSDVPLVPEPSLREELNDDLPDDLLEKKPAKVGVKAPPNRRRQSTLEAG